MTEEEKTPTLVIASKVKDYLKGKEEVNVSADVVDELSNLVAGILDRAILRCKNNGRKTIKATDL